MTVVPGVGEVGGGTAGIRDRRRGNVVGAEGRHVACDGGRSGGSSGSVRGQ